jgi:hypothetical protein
MLAEWWCKFIHSHKHWVKLSRVDKRAREDIWHCVKCGKDWTRDDQNW